MKERGYFRRGLIRHPVTLEPRARGVAGRALISDRARDSNSYRFKDVVLPSLYFPPLILPLVESNSNNIRGFDRVLLRGTLLTFLFLVDNSLAMHFSFTWFWKPQVLLYFIWKCSRLFVFKMKERNKLLIKLLILLFNNHRNINLENKSINSLTVLTKETFVFIFKFLNVATNNLFPMINNLIIIIKTI